MPQSKLEKQNAAASRCEARQRRGHKGQLAHLDSLFGVGFGASKERSRLASLMLEDSKPKKSESKNGDKQPKKSKRVREE